ncbi:MAG: hypothetical protein KJ906_00085 [Nanoarchaeota archaeon]|nr:hypothetical protein [Nanoarchaeota archaeon]
MPIGILYTKNIQCENRACNNGCPLLKMAQDNSHKLGGFPETEAGKYHRKITVEGETILDVDYTMIGSGILEISGQRQHTPDRREYCHLIIKKSKDNGSENYLPDIDVFKKLSPSV